MTLSTLRILSDKRDGRELSDDQIQWLVDQHVADEVPDYQMAAFAMAVFLRGMTPAETAALTRAKLHSGAVMTWPAGSPVVDKHSTGGIGDKVSLILAPMLAACGLRVPMISGRGLGPTGGTLDKLESIMGFRTDLSITEIQSIVQKIGCCITGANEEIAPADRKLYALRDVTATVSSVPLITASIMSKKLAEGLSSLVLDVKVGSGAFMKTRAAARELAGSLIDTGRRLNVETRAVMTDMNQPLGRLIGNAVEVDESIAALQGVGPTDLMEVVFALGEELLLTSRKATNQTEARELLQRTINSGAAYERFERMVRAQGGDLSKPRPRGEAVEVLSPKSGSVAAVDTETLGWAVIELGGGRRHMGDPIDHSVGLEMLKRIGDVVEAQEPWLRVFRSSDPDRTRRAVAMLEDAVTITNEDVAPLDVVIERL